MLNLLSKALSAIVLDGDARESLEEAGGLASAIQGSADMRTVIQQLKAEQPAYTRPAYVQQMGGYTPLTSPSTMLAHTLQNPAVMTNSAALQAALLAEILASARATASGVERPVASQLTAPKPVAPRAPAPMSAQTHQQQPFNPPPPTSPLTGAAGTLHTAIMAQALANARAAVNNVTAQPAMQMPVPQRMPAMAPVAPPPPRGKKLPPAERAQLIQNALKVHSAKQAILSNLTGEQRAKLAELAAKLLDPTSGSGEA